MFEAIFVWWAGVGIIWGALWMHKQNGGGLSWLMVMKATVMWPLFLGALLAEIRDRVMHTENHVCEDTRKETES